MLPDREDIGGVARTKAQVAWNVVIVMSGCVQASVYILLSQHVVPCCIQGSVSNSVFQTCLDCGYLCAYTHQSPSCKHVWMVIPCLSTIINHTFGLWFPVCAHTSESSPVSKLASVNSPLFRTCFVYGCLRQSTATGSARWFPYPTNTWEPPLLTWVVLVSAGTNDL